MTRSEEVEAVAARWLVRQEESDFTASDQAELDCWLAESTEHKVALWRLRDSWSKGDPLSARRVRPTGRQAPLRGRRQRIVFAAGIAAVLLAGILIAPLMLSPTDRFETVTGAQQTVRLADGSRVQLNTATRLRADIESDGRTVWLDEGEAFFEVAHDASRPFVVHAGSRTVTVLGTKFSVRRHGEQIQVSVLEGKVRLEDGRRKSEGAQVLTSGAIALTSDAGVITRQATLEGVQDQVSWRTGVLVFDQVTLAEAVSEFNRYNERQLRIADPTVAEMRIGGRLQAHNVDGFVRLLQRSYGLSIRDDGTTVTISQ